MSRIMNKLTRQLRCQGLSFPSLWSEILDRVRGGRGEALETRLLKGFFFALAIDQCRCNKIQPKTKDLSTRLRGINPTNSVVIPRSLVLRSIVFGLSLIYRYWSIQSIVVLVWSGDNRNKGLQNIGSLFLQMKALSNSLGTGLDKLDGDKDLLPPPRQRTARSVGKQNVDVESITSSEQKPRMFVILQKSLNRSRRARMCVQRPHPFSGCQHKKLGVAVKKKFDPIPRFGEFRSNA